MLKIYVNGSIYEYWTSARVNRDLDDTIGSFSFTTSAVSKEEFPLHNGDKVKISADGETILTGYIRRTDTMLSSGGATITVSGTDKTCDIIDSAVPQEAKFYKESITIDGIASRIIGALGADIGVKTLIKDNTPFKADEIEAVTFGQKALDFIQNYARKRSAFTTTDGKGNLVFFYPPMGSAGGQLTFKLNDNEKKENTVFGLSSSKDDSKRFNKYKCSSQDNLSQKFFEAGIEDLEKQVNRNKEYIDSDIRASRYCEIQAEESMSDEEVYKRCQEEANIRRGQGFAPRYSVHYHSANGVVWNTGQSVTVHDELSDIYGTFLIKQVSYTDNKQGGCVTEIIITYPDTYTGKGGRSTKSKRTAKAIF